MRETQDRAFPTQEIGSIAKPSWRVKGVSGESRITQKDIEEAEKWGRQLEIPNYLELVGLLKKMAAREGHPADQEKDFIRNWSVKFVLSLFDRVGLDRVYSGEQWRVEMYEHLVRNIQGFKLLGSVHSFDYKYFTKGSIVAPPKFTNPIHLEEFEFVKSCTSKEIKIPITGPYTAVDWSFNEYYEGLVRSKSTNLNLRQMHFEARREFILALVRDALRPEVENLIQNGARWIQIDEPAITTRPDDEEMSLFVEATNELTRGFGNCTFSLHNCYSDYKLLARYSPDLNDVKQLALEFANRDSTSLGTSIEERNGYADLQAFEDEGYEGGFGLGVLHVHDYSGQAGNGAQLEGRNIMETPKLVRDRILVASKLLKDPSRISVNPDCGLRTRSWDVTFAKLKAMEEGTKLAREQVA
ncbi:MAG: uroporphyrinogen decarboxylase/cobalamine-independent methonine synthase family protein [Nitrososphaerales archaeon]